MRFQNEQLKEQVERGQNELEAAKTASAAAAQFRDDLNI